MSCRSYTVKKQTNKKGQKTEQGLPNKNCKIRVKYLNSNKFTENFSKFICRKGFYYYSQTHILLQISTVICNLGWQTL